MRYGTKTDSFTLIEAVILLGTVMVLFLFVVMMLDINTEEMRQGFTRFAPLGAIVTGVIVVELVTVFLVRNAGLPVLANPVPHPEDYSNTKELGAVLYTEHVYAFELASFLLLLAIVAAIVLTMRKRPGLKVQDISSQVRVRREDRVRLVSMKAEKD